MGDKQAEHVTDDLDKDARAFGVTVPAIHVEDTQEFIYWYDAHKAIQLFINYLSGAWLFTMAGVAGLDVNAALAVIREAEPKPKKRLKLLQEVRYFAAGVMKYNDEQSKSKQS